MAGLTLGAVGAWFGELQGLGLIALATGLLLAAVVLPTVRNVEFGLPVGVKVSAAVETREEELRSAFVDQKADLEICAQLLCDDPADATRILEASWADAVRCWRGDATGPEIRAYVLCVLVAMATAHRRWARAEAATAPAHALIARLPWEQRVVVVLHEFARLPRPQIAAILDEETSEVETRLRQARSAPGAVTPTGGAW